jgi:hypothetical protein
VRAAFMPQEESVPVGKPKGGYQLIPAVQLALAWWCYREKLIRLVDLRVWFAAWEMRARRCRRPAARPGRFGLEELERLTGLSARRLADALRRLEAARLLGWSPSAVEFPALPGTVPLPDRAAFARFLDRIPNYGRRVPVPRRTLRLLAGGARPALIATILGHLVRCLYLRQGKCSARGRVKASWIADTFGVGLRRVKEARRQLIAMGWLIPLAADQWALNRWGAHVRINLDWSRLGAIEDHPDAPAQDSELAPPVPVSGPELAPPESDDKPLEGCKNQEPALGGPAGVCTIERAEKTEQPAEAVQSVATAESPPPAALATHAETPQGARLIYGMSCPRICETPGGCSNCICKPSAWGWRRPASGGGCVSSRWPSMHASSARKTPAACSSGWCAAACGISPPVTMRRQPA